MLILVFAISMLNIPLIDAATLTGTVSFTPTTIRTSATYTIELANSRRLEANEV